MNTQTWTNAPLDDLCLHLASSEPLSAVPMYLAMTSDYSPARQMLQRGAVVAVLILAAFTLVGDLIIKEAQTAW